MIEYYLVYFLVKVANTAIAAQAEGKSSDVKDQSSTKKSRGTSGAGNEKVVENGKAASGSANDGASQRWVVLYFSVTYSVSLIFFLIPVYQGANCHP